MNHRALIALTAFSLAAATSAQDGTSPQAGFDAACKKMRKLSGVKFTSLEIQTNSISRQVGSEDIEVEGNWSAGVVQANLNLGEDLVVISEGRMITKREDGAWKLRNKSLTNGEPLPFVFDPSLFFDLLARVPEESRRVLNRESTTYRGKELEIYSITMEGEASVDFALGGTIPPVSAGTGMGGMIMRRLGGGGGASSAPEITLDLAVYVDPETNLIHRIKAKTYKANPMGANLQVQIRGAGGGNFNAGADDDEAEEDTDEFDEAGNPRYKKGLRIRKRDDSLSVMEFDVRLTEHGKSFALELNKDTNSLLKGR